MISLDQVLLLEQKVESAVKKITQLQAENDALRSKCAELTNALSCKSEQLSSYEQNQNKIESGILQALDRLSSIENSVLNSVTNALQNQNNNQNIQVASPSNPEVTFQKQEDSFIKDQSSVADAPLLQNNFQGQIAHSQITQSDKTEPTENKAFQINAEDSSSSASLQTNFQQMDQFSLENDSDLFNNEPSSNDGEADQFDIF